MTDAPDTELMIRAGSDDEDAFAVLVERYQNVLLNLFLRKGVSYTDGEDLTQRTFLRLWRYRAKYSPQAKFTTFLFMLALQEAADFFRAVKRRRNLEEGLAAELEVAADANDFSADLRREVVDVNGALARLPDGLRDVVELGIFQNLPYAEVSTVLGIPLGTVKSRMFHALRKLKEMFKNERGR